MTIHKIQITRYILFCKAWWGHNYFISHEWTWTPPRQLDVTKSKVFESKELAREFLRENKLVNFEICKLIEDININQK